MAIETKDEFYERVMSMEKPVCPHCRTEMTLWETPPINFGDGLGWGSPWLFVCFNDECELYKTGWDAMEKNYGQSASYRCMCCPGESEFGCMPVFSPSGGKGQLIDDADLMREETLKENIKKGFSVLADCYVQKDGVTALNILMNPAEPARVRLKAAEMIGDIGEIEAVDPLRSHSFPSEPIQLQVTASIERIHERHGTRECPHCAEIIRRAAESCAHCGQPVADGSQASG